jgi:serine/threonine protein kinase
MVCRYLSAEALSGWSGEQVDAAFDLLTRCLEYSPQRRIAAHEALRHPFFALDPTTAAVVSPGASSTASSSSAAAAPG